MPRVKQCRQIQCRQLARNGDAYCTQHSDLQTALNTQRNQEAVKHYNAYARTRNVIKREQNVFYQSKSWKHKRLVILQRDNYLCRLCRLDNIVTSGNTVDHIVPFEVKSDWKLDADNLAVICNSCHSKKTAWEQKYYGTGKGRDITRNQSVALVKDLSAVKLLMT